MKLASCNSALNPPVVYSTDRSKAVVPVLVLLFVALWFILRGDLFYVLPCVILLLSLLATASRLFAIAWGFTSGFSSQLFMRIFIRALLLNQTQCGTIKVN